MPSKKMAQKGGKSARGPGVFFLLRFLAVVTVFHPYIFPSICIQVITNPAWNPLQTVPV